jgi:ABC-2 type transport system ATP-binding protein
MRRALPSIHWTRRRVVTWSVVGALVAGLLIWAVVPTPTDYDSHAQMLTVKTGPAGDQSIVLDTTVYVPKSAGTAHPVPTVLLAHGFGGTKDSVATQAEDLASRGYAVMTWTAEGFGQSGGQIHLDSPDWEIKDGSRLIDWMAAQPYTAKKNGDIEVAAVGGSYGGGFALMLAANDPRVDAIVPMITWNDLSNAFLPASSRRRGPACSSAAPARRGRASPRSPPRPARPPTRPAAASPPTSARST